MKSKLYLISCLYCLFAVHSGAQVISTFAGNGMPAYGGDGGAAVLGYLDDPYGICLDTLGNLYIADADNNRIRKVDTSGIITTFAGNGSPGSAGDSGLATVAGLYSPWSVIADKAGNIYFTDAGNFRIRKVNAAGIIYTIAGNGTWGYMGDGGPATAAEITSSYGIAVDGAGNVYFSDPTNNVIRKINTSGGISTIAGTSGAGYSGDGGQATAAQLQNPHGIATDASGNLYIADCNNNRIRKISAAGVISTIAGNGAGGYSGDNIQATAAQINGPNGVSVDAAGNVYIADQANARLRKVNTTGIITTIAGTGTGGFSGDGGPATAAKLNSPTGMAIAGNGNIYIADYNNNRIRVLDNVPAFINGAVQPLSVCGPATQSINSLLAVTDIDMGQTETWSLATPPVHGAATVAYTTISTGGTLTPAGLSYTPVSGYTGADALQVRITDGAVADTTTINITVQTTSNPGSIIGGNKVCIGAAITLTETVTGGTWSCSNPDASVSGGVATGITTGIDSVIYTVTNACGPATAIWPIAVLPPGDCDTIHTSTGIPANTLTATPGLTIYPNPGQGIFTIKLSCPANTETRFVVTNILGIKVKKFVANANTPFELKPDAPPVFISSQRLSYMVSGMGK